MSPKQSAFTDLVIPLTREPSNWRMSPHSKASNLPFAATEDYRILLDSYGARRSSWYTASFAGDAKWRIIRVPFAAFQSKGSTSSLSLRELRALHFELARPAGADAWLDLDDLKLY